MKAFEEKKEDNQNRRHATGEGLQLGRACCRACPRLTKKGQQIVEYALVITAISVALTVMYVYMKRGLQAMIKNKVDAEVGPQIDSLPLLGEREFSNVLSNMMELTTESTRIQEGAGGAQHVYDSTMTASGNSIGCSGQVFVPTGVVDAE